ncbi:MAG: hypothetical protein IPK20_00520 [Betaproteobacteria bacterium]|nr:hypothetical protein [Betaproteobacteria bacterium]
MTAAEIREVARASGGRLVPRWLEGEGGEAAGVLALVGLDDRDLLVFTLDGPVRPSDGDSGAPAQIPGDVRCVAVEILDPRFRTADGVHPGERLDTCGRSVVRVLYWANRLDGFDYCAFVRHPNLGLGLVGENPFREGQGSVALAELPGSLQVRSLLLLEADSPWVVPPGAANGR